MDGFWHGLDETEGVSEPEHPPIPELRTRLSGISLRLRTGDDPLSVAREIDRIVGWLWRRRAIRRAPPDSRPVTPELARLIRDLATEHPDWTEQRIAAETGVKNQGRVSEVLAGFRR